MYLSILSRGQGGYRSAKAQNSTKAPPTGNPNQLGPHMLRDRAPPYLYSYFQTRATRLSLFFLQEYKYKIYLSYKSNPHSTSC
jgi:hypothetical protein